MDYTAPAVIEQRRRSEPVAADKQRVTARVRQAIEAMVWGGLQRRDAAQAAGLAEHSLYQALRRPPVKQLYLSELQVLRDSERARSVHALIAVRDQTDNQKARVDAVRALHGDDFGDDVTRQHSAPTKGVVIQIVNAVTPALPERDVTSALPNDINGLDDDAL